MSRVRAAGRADLHDTQSSAINSENHRDTVRPASLLYDSGGTPRRLAQGDAQLFWRGSKRQGAIL